jgi:hypothetical protein
MSRCRVSGVAARIGTGLLLAVAVAGTPAAPLRARNVHSAGNPILADGRDYSADPAPLVADGMLYIIAGRD